MNKKIMALVCGIIALATVSSIALATLGLNLTLRQKNPSGWSIVPHGAYGTLTGGTFDFHGALLQKNTQYTLIRYTDPWPGYPVVCLGSSKSTLFGTINIDGMWQSGGNKVWLVLSSDVDCTAKQMTAWNPTSYLFETGLIQ